MSKELEKYPVENIALSRLGHQYGHSPLYRDFVRASVDPIVDLQGVFFNLLDIDLHAAKGIKLDLLGRIIGAPAVIADAIPQPFFGFEGQEAAAGFGEIGEPEEGGFFRESGQPSNIDWVLDSDTYRRVVDAQIVKNNSNCSPDEIIKTVKLIFGDNYEFKYYEAQMAVIIAPLEDLTMQYKQLLRALLPIGGGVSLAIINGQYEELNLTAAELADIYSEYY